MESQLWLPTWTLWEHSKWPRALLGLVLLVNKKIIMKQHQITFPFKQYWGSTMPLINFINVLVLHEMVVTCILNCCIKKWIVSKPLLIDMTWQKPFRNQLKMSQHICTETVWKSNNFMNYMHVFCLQSKCFVCIHKHYSVDAWKEFAAQNEGILEVSLSLDYVVNYIVNSYGQLFTGILWQKLVYFKTFKFHLLKKMKN